MNRAFFRTGKSTLLECVRAGANAHTEASVINTEVWPDVLTLSYIDEQGTKHSFRREKSNVKSSIFNLVSFASSSIFLPSFAIVCASDDMECLTKAQQYKGFGILAHIDIDAGFEKTIGAFNPQMDEILKHENLYGLEISNNIFFPCAYCTAVHELVISL